MFTISGAEPGKLAFSKPPRVIFVHTRGGEPLLLVLSLQVTKCVRHVGSIYYALIKYLICNRSKDLFKSVSQSEGINIVIVIPLNKTIVLNVRNHKYIKIFILLHPRKESPSSHPFLSLPGTRDMKRAYSDVREANYKDSDKYFHAAQRGPRGAWAARVIRYPGPWGCQAG